MKFFAYILSFYILFLTALPCVDKPDDNTMLKSEISSPNNHSQHGDIDHCSPFCTCNCCSSPKIQQDIVIDFNSYQILLESFTEFTPILISSHIANIWQPPQLGNTLGMFAVSVKSFEFTDDLLY